MITWCFALKLNFSHKKLYWRFHYFEFFISIDSCEAWKLIDLPKLSTLIQPELYPLLWWFCTYLRDIDIRKIFPKYMDPVISTGWKKFSCHMLLSFSKKRVLLWHHYQVIHRYENLNRSTWSIYVYFYYIIICIFMYIKLWCIITAFQTPCNA